MRKKEILRQNELLTDRLLEYDKVIANLKQQIDCLTDENQQLVKQLQTAKESIAAQDLSKPAETIEKPLNAIVTESTDAFAQPGSAPLLTDEHSIRVDHFDFLNEAPIDCQKVTPDQYAVKTISALILDSTRLQCVLSTYAGANRDDLLNRALGRTESAKAEIFRILEISQPACDAVSQIAEEYAKATSYFHCVEAEMA